ncbi:hypothetical protein ESA94_14000 [Lacibacter luteus]|uniref:Uncharacterized protein n=1 Tax=Lacibacter luteus TaxID=2508719 RepID=A0A4Q1CGH0_9BACT|nr:DUF6263 family protein [Lacibacter luteus]RXK59250.1 hypothetical protein ESA94_14000 [Lacibacter luteus]
MKTTVVIAICVLFLSCTANKSKSNVFSLKPESGKVYRYAVEDKFQIMIDFPDGNKEVYGKHFYDYSVIYDRKDTTLNGTVTFDNFRIEFEDGQGIQVFDTKFDKPDTESPDLWFYYSLLGKKIPMTFSSVGRVLEIKAVEQIKQKMVDDYNRNGLSNPQLTSALRKIADYFIVHRLASETYAFYSGTALIKDSSFNIRFTSYLPFTHSLQYKYNIRSETDSSQTLAGSGRVTLNDSLKQAPPFSMLKNKMLSSEAFDEITVQKQTHILQYRKSYFNLADSLVLGNKAYPSRIIVEKETKLKKPE